MPSQIQRVSVTKQDYLNLPAGLPSVYVNLEPPQPASKGILSGSGSTSVDRNELCKYACVCVSVCVCVCVHSMCVYLCVCVFVCM